MEESSSGGIGNPHEIRDKILEQATHQWLSGEEIFFLLENRQILPIIDEPQQRPRSGSILFYDMDMGENFRTDGYEWKKTKIGQSGKYNSSKLRVEGKEEVRCYYCHESENEHFQRRYYQMIKKPVNPPYIIVVHYLNVAAAVEAITVQRMLDLEQSDQNQLFKNKLGAWVHEKVYDRGEDPKGLDRDGLGALHYAAALGFNRILKFLIIAGVDVNDRDKNGWTALHWAAYFGRMETVNKLLKRGADAGSLTSHGLTPMHLALATEHHQIAEELRGPRNYASTDEDYF